jgi:hypothetical protein
MIKKKINGIEVLVTEPGDNTITMGRQYEEEILGKGHLYQKLKEEEINKKDNKKTDVPKSAE